MITSTKNQQVKTVINLQKSKKERTAGAKFAVEGLRIVRDALLSVPQNVEKIYASETFAATNPEMMAMAEDVCEVETVTDYVFAAMCETVTPQGILAVVKMMEWSVQDMKLSDESCRLVILEDIQDPGNLGTIIRTAEAAGIDGVIMSRTTADIYNPKVIRSTMGSIFRVPFVYSEDIFSAIDSLKAHKVTTYAAYLHGGTSFNEVEFAKKCAVMIGNEGNGLTKEIVEAADRRVFIPMAGSVESLNASIAAALFMFRM